MTDYGVIPTGFLSKTYNEVLESLMENARQIFGYEMDLSTGTILGQKLRTNAVEITALWQALEGAYYSAFVSSAEGQSLDRVVALVGITRKAATAATGIVTFSVSEAGTVDISIPAGSEVGTSDESILFKTSEAGTLPAGETSVDVPVIAQDPGNEGNVSSATIVSIISTLSGIDTVTNPAAMTGGGDSEADADLRIRAMTQKPEARGTIAALESAILALDGVEAVNIIEDTDEHTVSIYTSGGDDTEISAAIEDTRPCGIAVTWDYASVLDIDVNVSVVKIEGVSDSAAEEQVRTAISECLGGQSIGGGISYYNLLIAIAVCSYVSNVSALSFTDGESTASAIGDTLIVDEDKKPELGTVVVTIA